MWLVQLIVTIALIRRILNDYLMVAAARLHTEIAATETFGSLLHRIRLNDQLLSLKRLLVARMLIIVCYA